MRNHLVYDLPTRLFHWVFTALFVTAYTIGSTAEDTALFPWHMLAGLTMGLAVVLRVLWGVIGTRHARFAEFQLRPMALIGYFKGLFTGGDRPVAGHNPASSWVAIVLIGLALGLGVTGYLMTSSGNFEAYEEVHEVLANTFLAVVLMHIGGVILHSLRRGRSPPPSMPRRGCREGTSWPRFFSRICSCPRLPSAGFSPSRASGSAPPSRWRRGPCLLPKSVRRPRRATRAPGPLSPLATCRTSWPGAES